MKDFFVKVSPLVEWICLVTNPLFVVRRKPLFALVNENCADDFSSCVSHILAILGADVVCLCRKESVENLDYLCFDGVFFIKKCKNFVDLEFVGSNRKNKDNYCKKRFPQDLIGLVGSIHRLQNKT